MAAIRLTTLPSPCHVASQRHFISPAFSSPKPLSVSSSHLRTTGVSCRRFPILPRCSGQPTTSELQKKGDEIDLKGTSIFLVGMNSFMKLSAGQVLAGALEYCYIESDSVVEEAFGGEAATQMAHASDEESFLESETEVLKQLTSMGRLVVSTGDNAVQNKTNLGLLRYGITIWIDVPVELIADEYRETLTNPASLPQTVAKLSMRYNKLKGGCGTADATVSLQRLANQKGILIEHLRAEDVAMEILVQIEKLMRAKKMMEDAAKPF